MHRYPDFNLHPRNVRILLNFPAREREEKSAELRLRAVKRLWPPLVTDLPRGYSNTRENPHICNHPLYIPITWLCVVEEFCWGGSATNGATISCFQGSRPTPRYRGRPLLRPTSGATSPRSRTRAVPSVENAPNFGSINKHLARKS